MGVEYGFYSVSKYSNTTLEEFMRVEDYIQWKDNPWNQENYPSYKKYWESFLRVGDEKYPGEPNSEKVAYYSEHKEDSDGYTVARCIGFWASIGTELDEKIREWLNMSSSEYYKQIDKSFIDTALAYTEKELELNKLVPMTVISNVGKVKLESDFGDQIEVPLTGQRIYLETPKYDTDKRYMLKLFRDTLYEIKSIDFNSNLIWYYRSW